MNKTVFAIRLILTSILLWFIYGETGPVTTVFAALVGLHSEIVGRYMTITNESLKGILERLKLTNNNT